MPFTSVCERWAPYWPSSVQAGLGRRCRGASPRRSWFAHDAERSECHIGRPSFQRDCVSAVSEQVLGDLCFETTFTFALRPAAHFLSTK
ncbi:hypothetical protein PI125_g2912 [Phytophthora idaei]|nr:hypothetical protein PI125_g2912 [Phytophthora idaei]KAG3164404.1 hypothetical protein PI126_g5100 [Phytophthora idaei]